MVGRVFIKQLDTLVNFPDKSENDLQAIFHERWRTNGFKNIEGYTIRKMRRLIG